MVKFRDLTADDIECRVQSVKDSGLILLLYKNARVDMNILDETVSPENWQREHYECKGNLFCRVGIKCGDEWVFKSDCGTESNTEAQKGEASDSFKRACFNWGIGRELYSSPFIWIPSANCKIENKRCDDKFNVESITITDKKITALKISRADRYGNGKKVAFEWADGKMKTVSPKEVPKATKDKPKTAYDCFRFTTGKYAGKALSEVAQIDKEYFDTFLKLDDDSKKAMLEKLI